MCGAAAVALLDAPALARADASLRRIVLRMAQRVLDQLRQLFRRDLTWASDWLRTQGGEHLLALQSGRSPRWPVCRTGDPTLKEDLPCPCSAHRLSAVAGERLALNIRYPTEIPKTAPSATRITRWPTVTRAPRLAGFSTGEPDLESRGNAHRAARRDHRAIVGPVDKWSRKGPAAARRATIASRNPSKNGAPGRI